MAEAQPGLSFNPAELIKRVEDTEKRLQTKDAEIQVYKMLISQMEEELSQAKKYKAMQDKQTQDIDSIKVESEKTLTKAKSLIFERTKIIKNQELQIEAFTQQIESLKEVVRITKDLLEIRNLEIKQLENKISAIEGRMKCEHERYDLMHKKLEQMIRHNGELKREYETQLCLFSALRERYNERELAKDVVDDLKVDLVDAKEKLDNIKAKENMDKEVPADDEAKSEKSDKDDTPINIEKPNSTKGLEDVLPEANNNAIVAAKENLDNIKAKENMEKEEVPAEDIAKSEESDKDDTPINIENLDNTKGLEDVLPEANNNAIVDAKNRLDNILSVLENSLGLDDTIIEVEAQENIPEENEPKIVQDIEEKNEVKINENEVNKNETQADIIQGNEPSSTLDNILSALKNTIGFGTEKTQTEESTSQNN